MATCRECLHFETCLNDKQQTRYYGEKEACNNVQDLCRYFLSKSDYVKRERGKWLKHKPDPKVMDEFHKMGIGKAMNRNSIYWTCSCCGTWGTPIHKFCSECGAEMRKEDNNA